jgi:threonine dehydrogenase-like Zn-dependent dehydrogenase
MNFPWREGFGMMKGVRPLITHRPPIMEIARAFDLVKTHHKGMVKVVLNVQ